MAVLGLIGVGAVVVIASTYRPMPLGGYGAKGRPDLGSSIILSEGGGRAADATGASTDAEVADDQGCIYCVKGKNTRSGRDYIGSSDDMDKRERDKSDGRNRDGAEIVDTYPKGNRDVRRNKEQQAMNDRGGVDNLDNRRNEVAPKKWDSRGIAPPPGN